MYKHLRVKTAAAAQAGAQAGGRSFPGGIRMKKEKWMILISVLLLVAVFAVLSACGGNKTTSETVVVTDENGEPLTDANGNPITAVLEGEIVEITNANGEKSMMKTARCALPLFIPRRNTPCPSPMKTATSCMTRRAIS